MEKTTLEQTIITLTQNKKYKTLRDILSVLNAVDIAQVFEAVEREKLPVLFRLLPKTLASLVFIELDEDIRDGLVRVFSDDELTAVIDELYADDAADLVEEMPANVVKRILKNADPSKRRLINEILRYPEDSAGSIMNNDYIALRINMDVTAATTHIRKTGRGKETVNTLYVLDNNRLLLGAVTLRDLVFASPDDAVETIMNTNVLSVGTLDDKESVARAFEKYDFHELPVVDTEGRLVGIVTVDDAIDVIEDEATEDIEKMAAITPSDKPYLKTSAGSIFLKRIPWLLLLMVSATFTGMIISGFEDALGALPVLTAFIPMLMDTGGNSGSQASVTVIRGISLGEIRFADAFRVLFKELRVSLMCGVILSAVSFAKIMLFDNLVMSSGISPMIALVVSLTLLATIVMAKLIGCTMPLLAGRLGFDPAVMASPFITTVVDALSLLVYFGFAVSILGI